MLLFRVFSDTFHPQWNPIAAENYQKIHRKINYNNFREPFQNRFLVALVDLLAFEPSAFNLCVEDILFVCLLQFKNILVQYHEIGIFPDLDGSALLLQAEAYGTVYCEALERLGDSEQL